jgi:hypothetical protein
MITNRKKLKFGENDQNTYKILKNGAPGESHQQWSIAMTCEQGNAQNKCPSTKKSVNFHRSLIANGRRASRGVLVERARQRKINRVQSVRDFFAPSARAHIQSAAPPARTRY